MLPLNHQSLHEAVSQESIQFVDETWHQRGSEKCWILTRQNFTYFITYHDRTKKAAQKLLDKRHPLSLLVTDHYPTYTTLVYSSVHQLYWAHVLRNLMMSKR